MIFELLRNPFTTSIGDEFTASDIDGSVVINNERLELQLNNVDPGVGEFADNEQNSINTNFGFGEWADKRYRGQVFTCNTTGEITKIGFARNKGSKGLKIYIDTVDGSNLPEHSIGSELYSFVVPHADVIDEYGEYDLPVPLAVTATTKYCFYIAPWDAYIDAYADDYNDARGIGSVSGGITSIANDNGTWSTESLTFQYKVYVALANVFDNYAKITSNAVYDLTNSFVRVELLQSPVSVSTISAYIKLYEDSASGEFKFYYKGGNLIAEYKNTSGSFTALGSTPYIRADHKFLQIRHDGTNINFDVSADLLQWQTLFVTTHNLDLADLILELGAETVEDETRLGVVAFGGLNSIAPIILPNRKFQIKTGFNGTLIDKFDGVAEYPDSTIKETKFHIYDDLEIINDFKLSAGGLQESIRTDIYIQGILDEVYADFFTTVVSAEVAENFTEADTADASTFTDDTSNFRYGSASKKINVDNGGATADLAIAMDLSGFDAITFDIWVDDISTLSEFNVYLGDISDGDLYKYELVSELSTGWNSIKRLKTDYDALVGSAVPWTMIDDIRFEVITVASEIAEVNFDEVRFVANDNYPQRIFDSGLSIIPVAWWGGNSALYEIKIASEAEGGRFFADEQGRLIFQNRQHFNVNDEYKTSVYGFNFNNATDLMYTGKISDIINKVTVVLKPRRKESTQVVWTYFDVPKQIDAGDTLTIWANFDSPVFNVVTPVATTDYTGNSNSDGSGANRTADISIVITKFGTSSKLEIENTSGTNLFLTLMQVRGEPATESSAVLIESEDTTSISRYGIQPAGGLTIENKYLSEEEFAQSLADSFVDRYATPNSRVIIKGRSIPHLQLGDMVSVDNAYLEQSFIMRIIEIKEQFSSGSYNAEYKMRNVTDFETLDFFTIATSAIESTDVISI